MPGLRSDLIAGATLAAYLLPAAIGDASLAGLPPEAGISRLPVLRARVLAPLQFRHTAITVTSAMSLLIGASVGELSGGDPARQAALAACTALMVAALAFAAWVARAGSALAISSRRPCSSASRAEWRCTWRARSCRSSSASAAPTAISGIARRTSWRTSATRTRPRCSLGTAALALPGCSGEIWLTHRPTAFFAVIAGIAATRLLDLGERGVALLGEVPQGLAALGTAPGQPERRERAAAARGGVLRARRRRDVRHRPHVRGQARLSARPEPGVPRPRRGQPDGRAGPRLSRQRRHVAVARQRKRRRAHAALGSGRRPDHAGRRALRGRHAAKPAAARAGGDRARRRYGSRGHRRAPPHLAVQPRGVRSSPIAALAGGARVGPGERRAARRAPVRRPAASAGGASARDRARARSGHRRTSPIGRATPRTNARRACSSSGANRRCSISMPPTSASSSSSCSPAATDPVRLVSSSLARCRDSTSPARRCWPNCTARCASEASCCDSPRRMARSAMRCAASDSTGTTARSNPG